MNPATFNYTLEATEELLELMNIKGELSKEQAIRCSALYASMPVDYRKDMLIKLFKNEI
jgi:lipopolysaccharide biosynthesis protein